jgi:hypothetical protein
LEAREALCDRSQAEDAKTAQRGSPSRTAAVPDERAADAPGDGSKPYGNVTYADPGYQKDGKKRYPLDTKAHAKAAWAFINQADNASAYNSQQLANIKGKIKAALKKFGVTVSDENEAQLADEWRAKIEVKKALKAERRAARKAESRADHSMQCPACGVSLTVTCPVVGGNNKAHQLAVPPPGDPNVEGANHGVKGDATGSYDAKSADPVDEERGNKIDGGAQKRVPQIVALLNQALALFKAADIKSLPDDAQQAVALVSSAATHAGHIQHHAGLSPDDSVSDNDAKGRAADPKPDDKSTSATFPTDDALRLAVARMRSREIDEGI